MKRTPLNRSKSPLKRFSSLKTKKGLRKKGKEPISRLQRKIWSLCKEIIRKNYGNNCYTCPAVGLSGSNWHTGHMWAKAALGAYLKYDLRILRPQCYKCNIHHGGRGADFYARMIKEIGPEKMEELQADRSKIVRAYEYYSILLDQYKKILEAVSN